jgi:hypothetical protein
LSLHQNDRRKMEQELEKLRICSKELDKMKDERNSTNYQLSEQSNEIQMLKENVASNEFFYFNFC